MDIPLFFSGAMSTGDLKHRVYVPDDFRLTHIGIGADTAPTGAAMVIDVEDDTVSIFSDVLGNMPTIADGAHAGALTGLAKDIAAGSWLTFEVEQVGSTVAGSDVTLTLWGYVAHRS